jgi:uncharacterized repeat protein (TIGR04138 family)
MKKIRFEEAVRAIRERDKRFDGDAYLFLKESLDFTLSELRSEESIEHRHVSGPELLEGLREFSLREFGPMAATVLENWGIRSCEDIGEMVFQLINAGAFGKSEEDMPEDFSGVYDFDEAFREPFRPKTPPRSRDELGAAPNRLGGLEAGSESPREARTENSPESGSLS